MKGAVWDDRDEWETNHTDKQTNVPELNNRFAHSGHFLLSIRIQLISEFELTVPRQSMAQQVRLFPGSESSRVG